MNQLYKKEETLDFSKPQTEIDYVLTAHNALDLLHKEMDVNLAEQDLIIQRMNTIKGFLNELSDVDPNYAMLITQIQMDQIELDELKNREDIVSEHLKSISGGIDDYQTIKKKAAH